MLCRGYCTDLKWVNNVKTRDASLLVFPSCLRMDRFTHLTLSAQLAEKLLILKLAPLVWDNPRHLLQHFSEL